MLDYEEDVQDVKKFFKNQRPIFDNGLKMLAIYEGNRSYVLDPETITLVEQIEKITRLQSPYSEIHKLPELIEQFTNRFAQLLEDECEPIRASINTDWKITSTDLNQRSFKDKYAEKVRKDFGALIDRLSHANNIYDAIAMQTESDRMKQRFIQMFIDEEARLAAAAAKAGDDVPSPPIHKTKTVSAKVLFGGTNQISSRQDIAKGLEKVSTPNGIKSEPLSAPEITATISLLRTKEVAERC